MLGIGTQKESVFVQSQTGLIKLETEIVTVVCMALIALQKVKLFIVKQEAKESFVSPD